MQWSLQLSSEPVKSSPCVDVSSGLVWVGSHDQHLYAIDGEVCERSSHSLSRFPPNCPLCVCVCVCVCVERESGAQSVPRRWFLLLLSESRPQSRAGVRGDTPGPAGSCRQGTHQSLILPRGSSSGGGPFRTVAPASVNDTNRGLSALPGRSV